MWVSCFPQYYYNDPSTIIQTYPELYLDGFLANTIRAKTKDWLTYVRKDSGGGGNL